VGLVEDCRATILIADYIGVDAASKINAIGAGFSITGVQTTGLTGAMHVGVLVDVPSPYLGQEFALSLELRDVDAGSVVQVPGASGQPEALRIQNIVKAERPVIPGVYLPPNMYGRVQMVMAFTNGLPLPAGRSYDWWLQIDGQHRKGWVSRFHVAGPAPGPVIGGPAGPASIPNIPLPPPVD
jgi:hypothetical protein